MSNAPAPPPWTHTPDDAWIRQQLMIAMPRLYQPRHIPAAPTAARAAAGIAKQWYAQTAAAVSEALRALPASAALPERIAAMHAAAYSADLVPALPGMKPVSDRIRRAVFDSAMLAAR